jgi:hypothetical protein
MYFKLPSKKMAISHARQVHILGVPVRFHAAAALSGPLIAALVYLLSRRKVPNAPALAVAGALSWYEADLIHVAGHIVSSQMVDAPMDYVRWGFLAANGYRVHDVTPRQHIGRSLGGPIASGIAAIVYWLAWQALGSTLLGRAMLVASLQNGLVALGSLAPLPIVDGGVIYANLRSMSDPFQ